MGREELSDTNILLLNSNNSSEICPVLPGLFLNLNIRIVSKIDKLHFLIFRKDNLS